MNCDCWDKKNADLKPKGYGLSNACVMLAVNDEKLSLERRIGIPLMRADGAKLRRSDPRMLEISYCPFCGQKT